MIDRRSFLRVLLAGAAGAVLDPEKLLWVPGQKTIFLPSVEVFHGGDLSTIDAILKKYYTTGHINTFMERRSPLYDLICHDNDYIVQEPNK